MTTATASTLFLIACLPAVEGHGLDRFYAAMVLQSSNSLSLLVVYVSTAWGFRGALLACFWLSQPGKPAAEDKGP